MSIAVYALKQCLRKQSCATWRQRFMLARHLRFYCYAQTTSIWASAELFVVPAVCHASNLRQMSIFYCATSSNIQCWGETSSTGGCFVYLCKTEALLLFKHARAARPSAKFATELDAILKCKRKYPTSNPPHMIAESSRYQWYSGVQVFCFIFVKCMCYGVVGYLERRISS